MLAQSNSQSKGKRSVKTVGVRNTQRSTNTKVGSAPLAYDEEGFKSSSRKSTALNRLWLRMRCFSVCKYFKKAILEVLHPSVEGVEVEEFRSQLKDRFAVSEDVNFTSGYLNELVPPDEFVQQVMGVPHVVSSICSYDPFVLIMLGDFVVIIPSSVLLSLELWHCSTRVDKCKNLKEQCTHLFKYIHNRGGALFLPDMSRNGFVEQSEISDGFYTEKFANSIALAVGLCASSGSSPVQMFLAHFERSFDCSKKSLRWYLCCEDDDAIHFEENAMESVIRHYTDEDLCDDWLLYTRTIRAYFRSRLTLAIHNSTYILKDKDDKPVVLNRATHYEKPSFLRITSYLSTEYVRCGKTMAGEDPKCEPCRKGEIRSCSVDIILLLLSFSTMSSAISMEREFLDQILDCYIIVETLWLFRPIGPGFREYITPDVVESLVLIRQSSPDYVCKTFLCHTLYVSEDAKTASQGHVRQTRDSADYTFTMRLFVELYQKPNDTRFELIFDALRMISSLKLASLYLELGERRVMYSSTHSTFSSVGEILKLEVCQIKGQPHTHSSIQEFAKLHTNFSDEKKFPPTVISKADVGKIIAQKQSDNKSVSQDYIDLLRKRIPLQLLASPKTGSDAFTYHIRSDMVTSNSTQDGGVVHVFKRVNWQGAPTKTVPPPKYAIKIASHEYTYSRI